MQRISYNWTKWRKSHWKVASNQMIRDLNIELTRVRYFCCMCSAAEERWALNVGVISVTLFVEPFLCQTWCVSILNNNNRPSRIRITLHSDTHTHNPPNHTVHRIAPLFPNDEHQFITYGYLYSVVLFMMFVAFELNHPINFGMCLWCMLYLLYSQCRISNTKCQSFDYYSTIETWTMNHCIHMVSTNVNSLRKILTNSLCTANFENAFHRSKQQYVSSLVSYSPVREELLLCIHSGVYHTIATSKWKWRGTRNNKRKWIIIQNYLTSDCLWLTAVVMIPCNLLSDERKERAAFIPNFTRNTHTHTKR